MDNSVDGLGFWTRRRRTLVARRAGGPRRRRVFRERDRRGRRGATGLRVVVRAGLRAVGVQRCDAATAGRRREVLVPEASRAGPTLAGVLRVHYALYEYPGDDLHEAARAPKTPRRPRSFGVLGRRHADRGRAAPWGRLGRRACGGGFVVLGRIDGVVSRAREGAPKFQCD